MANKRIQKKKKKRQAELNQQRKRVKAYYCIDCLNPLKEDDEVCSCGSKSYISGRGLTIKGNACVCQCGGRMFNHHHTENLGTATSRIFECSECKEFLFQMIFEEKNANYY